MSISLYQHSSVRDSGCTTVNREREKHLGSLQTKRCKSCTKASVSNETDEESKSRGSYRPVPHHQPIYSLESYLWCFEKEILTVMQKRKQIQHSCCLEHREDFVYCHRKQMWCVKIALSKILFLSALVKELNIPHTFFLYQNSIGLEMLGFWSTGLNPDTIFRILYI